MRCECLSAHEHPARARGDRGPRRLPRNPPPAGARSGPGRQRPVARQPLRGICLGPRDPLYLGTPMARRDGASRALRVGGLGDAWQDHDREPPGVPPRGRGTGARVPHRGRAPGLRRLGAARERYRVRRRGRRVRHRVLRQALEVCPLSPARPHHHEHRIRPRRYLPGPRSDQTPVPSLGPHRPGSRDHRPARARSGRGRGPGHGPVEPGDHLR